MAMKKTLMVALGALSIAFLSACSSVQPAAVEADPSTSAKEVTMADIVGSCNANGFKAVKLAADSKTLTMVVGTGPGLPGIPWEMGDCILNGVAMPSSVHARMQATRAIDGQQQGSWDGYEASWSYSPKIGATIIITQH